jgi:acyl-[acyl-carrier-protein] desaturase
LWVTFIDQETLSKVEVIADLEPVVQSLMEAHEAKRPLWFPAELLSPPDGEGPEKHRTDLRARARGIGDPARVAMGLNLLTEEGLPHFHRLLALHLDENAYWSKWTNLWTAEEDRHGAVLHDYARDADLFDPVVIEKMQFAYLRAGFDPQWDRDPYRVFVYTTLQERATQVSHANTGKFCAGEEPTIGIILKNVAAEEARHYTFYRTIFKEVLARDPNRALESAIRVMPAIDMPGIKMPHFRDLADVVRRVGIYGPRDYLEIVREQLGFWKIDALEGLNAIGRAAQEKLMEIPQRLERVAEAIESRSKRKTFSFELTFAREFALE